MIQRIQTLYLLIVALCMGVMLSLPLGSFLAGEEEFVLRAFGIFSVSDSNELVVRTQYMGILIAMAAALPVLTVIFYRNRMLQIRLCFMEMVFLIGVQIYVIFYLYNATTGFGGLEVESHVKYSLVDLLPLLSLILMWLAYKGIVKDEALVRSLDRIR